MRFLSETTDSFNNQWDIALETVAGFTNREAQPRKSAKTYV